MYGDTVIHMEFSRTLNTMSIIQTGATMRKGSMTRYFGHLEAPLISKFVRITLNDMIVGRKHVFGIHLTPPFHHFCTNSVSSLNEQEPTKESPHTNIRKNYKGKLYKQADLATSIEYFNSDGICRHQYKILQHEVEKARDLGLIQTWLPFYLYNYHDYYDYLPKDQLNELLKINNSQLTHQDAVISSNDIASLPLDIQEILKANQSIPHTEEFTIQLPEINIDRPKVTKRYQMEEDYKALLIRRKRSRSFILN
uniref:Uncharacterized protein n=1 Tax=Schistosoma haematobium TaxID=6185 RepID=A0A095AQX0_SCHHA